MAGLKVEFTKDANFDKFMQLLDSFHNIPMRMLRGVGKKTAYILLQMLKSGKYLHFSNYTTKGHTKMFSAKGNKSMITIKGSKKGDRVTIASFPLNLFERKRRGYKDKIIYRAIMRSKLAASVKGQLNGWGNHYMDVIVKDILS